MIGRPLNRVAVGTTMTLKILRYRSTPLGVDMSTTIRILGLPLSRDGPPGVPRAGNGRLSF
eukprot:3362159-Rhodomonas_salina.3